MELNMKSPLTSDEIGEALERMIYKTPKMVGLIKIPRMQREYEYKVWRASATETTMHMFIRVDDPVYIGGSDTRCYVAAMSRIDGNLISMLPADLGLVDLVEILGAAAGVRKEEIRSFT